MENIINSTNTLYTARTISKIPIKSFDIYEGAVVLYSDSYDVLFKGTTKNRPHKNLIGAVNHNGNCFTVTSSNDETILINETLGISYIIDHKGNAEPYIKPLLVSVDDTCIALLTVSNTLLYVDIKASTIKKTGTNYYICSIREIVVIPPGVLLSGTSYSACGDIIIPIEGTYDVIKIKDASATKVTIVGESLFSTPSMALEGGNPDTPPEQKGIATTIVNNKNIIILDIESKESYTIPFSKEGMSGTVLKDTLYMISDDGLYDVDPYMLDVFQLNTNFKGVGFKIYSDNSNIYVYNGSVHYKLEKSNNTVSVTAYGTDSSGDIIGVQDIVTLKQQVITVNAPVFQGYMLDDSATKTVDGTSEYCSAEFNYMLSKTLCCINVTHKSLDDVFKTEKKYGLMGEDFSLEHLNIEGYSFSHSSGATGTFDRDVLSATFIYTSSYTNDSINSILDIKIKTPCGDINRAIGILRDDDVSIKPIDINYHTPLENMFVIGDITSALVFDNREYTSTNEVKPCQILYSGIEIYEDYVQITSDGSVNTNLPFGLEPIDPPLDTLMSRLVINVHTNEKIYLLRFVDMHTGEVISKMLSSSKVTLIPDISGYEYKNMSVNHVTSMTVTDVYYNKINSSITITKVDNIDGSILSSVTVRGAIGDAYKVIATDIGNRKPLFSDTVLTFKHSPVEYKFMYSMNMVIVTYEYRDVYSLDLVCSIPYVYVPGTIDMLPKIESPHNIIYSEVPVKNVTIKDATYTILVSPGPFTTTALFEEHKLSEILLSINTSRNEKRLITKITSSGYMPSVMPVYVLSPAKSSTTSYLSANSIPYTVIHENNIKTNKCVVINGNMDSHTLSTKFNGTDCIYIPLTTVHDSLKNTINLARNSTTGSFSVPYRTGSVDAYVDIKPVSYSPGKSLKLNVNVTPKEYNPVAVKIEVYEPVGLNIVYSNTQSFECSPVYNSFEYKIDGVQKSSRDYIIIDGVDSYLYSKEIELTCKNAVGDSTVKSKYYLELYLKNLKAISAPNKRYRPAVARINNRYKGPRESLKVVNFTRGINNACDDIEKILKEYE